MADAPLTDREPAAIGFGSVAALIDALVVLCDVFDWLRLDGAQTTAIIAFVTALCGVVGTLVRDRVWSPASVERLTGPQQGA